MLLFQGISLGIRPRAGGLNGMDSRLQPALDLIGGGNDGFRAGMTGGCHPRRDRGSMQSWLPTQRNSMIAELLPHRWQPRADLFRVS